MNIEEMDSEDRKFHKELAAGISALVLLSLLNTASGPRYGYQIAKLIDGQKENLPLLKQGALYPVLRSLESGGLLKSTVEPSVSGPPRRYYLITEPGRKALARWTETWVQTKTFVDDILKGEPHGQDHR